MHLVSVLVAHVLMAEHLLVRRPAVEHDGHEEERVEPEPDLLAHLRHPMGGEPLLPVGVIRKVRAREALGRAGCIALRNPLWVLPAERREGDDACVQPDVADLGHASYLLAARLATDRHVVDPWAVQLLELVEPRRRA